MSVRSFIAIELGEKEKRALDLIQKRLRRELPAVRWVKPASLHLTLRFLGYVKERDLDRIKEIMNQIAADHHPFVMQLRGLGAFPSLKNPRVIWIGVREESGTLLRIAEHLDVLLEEMEVHSEERPYAPHLTIGRVKERGGGEVFASILPLYKDETAGETNVDRITLFRSDLTPDGPIYTVIHSAHLS